MNKKTLVEINKVEVQNRLKKMKNEEEWEEISHRMSQRKKQDEEKKA